MKNWQKILALVLAIAAAVVLWVVPDKSERKQYFVNKGYVFGTYYNYQYEAVQDLEAEIQEALRRFDASLSMFNPNSVISQINRNETCETDSLFRVMYATAREVSELSGGAFDITVRPLVNAWGFGNKRQEREQAQPEERKTVNVDSLREFVGYQLIHLEDERLIKSDKRVTIDASAIAKGFGVDVVAEILRSHGCTNYLVDIGGEVVAKGINKKGNAWHIGISKPVDDPDGTSQELQDIIETTDMAMATSGNYRQFYQDGAVRRSHTIDPRTGYPVEHNLLSATVIADNCMRADALATACMVMGAEEAIKMIEATHDASCYLIIAIGDGLKVITSNNWVGTQKDDQWSGPK